MKNFLLIALTILAGNGFSNCQVAIAQTETTAVDDKLSDEKLIWSDEFDGDALDLTKWKFETGTGHNGWGNNEWQNYTDEGNVEVSDGTLKITAKKSGDGQKQGDYTSARLNSIEHFKYGRIEIRAKMPASKGKGAWPALWLLGENIKKAGWPKCGEIDMMEYVSYDPDNVHFNYHSKTNNHMIGTNISSDAVKLETIEEEFHNFGLIWTEDRMQSYIDTPDNIVLTFDRPKDFNQDNWPFDQPFYLLMNVAVGGNWGGAEGVDDSIFPSTMEVDYVRIYEPK